MAESASKGGWPLTMFLTAKGEPVWGGTYFPKDSKFGRAAFTDVLREVARLFKEEPAKIEQNRAALLARLADKARPAGKVTIGLKELDAAAVHIGEGSTHLGIAAAFGLYGFVASDSRAIRTASQTMEALLATGITIQLLKRAMERRPDFIITVDPWTPYEAHTDHIRTGKAAAEAAILYNMLRLPTEPKVDAAFQPYELEGIAFYNSFAVNTYLDITHTRTKKHQALEAYKAQFSPEDLEMLHMWVEVRERMHAENCDIPGCTHAEGFKVLSPRFLHGVGESWKF